MQQRKNKVAKRAKRTDIISHWPKLIENLQYSSQEFYAKVEAALVDRKVPDLQVERVDWKEGGPLSPRREYLRLTRERLVFDVCGAPFGTGFFVSTWFGEKPLRLGLYFFCLLAFGILALCDWATKTRYGMYWFMWRHWHFGMEQTTLLLTGIFAIGLVALLAYIGPNLDNALIHMPVVGFFYERYFRKITFYRVDRTCMYQAAVQAAVTQVIDEITKAQGIAPLSEFDRRPVMRDLLQPQGSNGRH